MDTFQLGNRAIEGFEVWMVCARVIVAFVFSKFFVDVRGGLIDWCDDGPGGGIGFLPDMNGVGGKTHSALLAIPVPIVMQSVGFRMLTVRGEFQS